MADVENANLETGAELSEPPETDPKLKEVSSAHHPQPQQAKTTLAGILGKLFKRNGRHPADCQCPIHRSADAGSVWSPPVLSNDVPAQDVFHPPVVPLNPARFEMWGRLAARAVKSAFKWLTAGLPDKADRIGRLAVTKLGSEKGDALSTELSAAIKELPITQEELDDIQGSATRLAEKYQLTTGFDEEIEFGVTVGGVFGRVFLVTRRMDAALQRLESEISKT
jgi:hypothetical protein